MGLIILDGRVYPTAGCLPKTTSPLQMASRGQLVRGWAVQAKARRKD